MTDLLLIKNAHLIDETMDCYGSVFVKDGKIQAVLQGNNEIASIMSQDSNSCNDTTVNTFDAKGMTLMPAFIDMHAHFRDPGFTEKEDLKSGLQAAVAGGYGTVCCMANTSPVVSSNEMAKEIEERAKKLKLANLFQAVSITKDFDGKTTSHIDTLEKSVVPFISEDGYDVASSAVMLEAMKKAKEKNIIVACHCEDSSIAEEIKNHRKMAIEYFHNKNFTKSNEEFSEADELSGLAENLAIKRNLQIAYLTKCRIHICHVSTTTGINVIYEAKHWFGDKITCEVTPHNFYLSFKNKSNMDKIVNPPITNDTNRTYLLSKIVEGYVDVIATDHAPHTTDDKKNGSPGFSGLETAFAVSYTTLVHKNFINIQKLSRLMSSNPARILGLKKGVFRVGYDADFVLVDENEKWTIDSSKFKSKGKNTPFDGEEVFGKVKKVWVGGNAV